MLDIARVSRKYRKNRRKGLEYLKEGDDIERSPVRNCT